MQYHNLRKIKVFTIADKKIEGDFKPFVTLNKWKHQKGFKKEKCEIDIIDDKQGKGGGKFNLDFIHKN